MKKIIGLLSILLVLTALGMIVLYGASGHSVNLKDIETVKYLFLIVLYVSTSIVLLLYNYKNSSNLKVISKGCLVLTLISLLYLLYEILKVKIGDVAGVIPVLILFTIVFLDIRVLYYLLKK